MNPEVSIIIPAYNSEKYIGRAIESALNQTYRHFEIIVVDDASTDNTLKVAKNFTDRRLKILENQQNQGVSGSRNHAIQQARGNWIALLDSDDFFASRRIEKLLKVAKDNNADMVADNLYLINDNEQYPWSTLLQENQQEMSSIELVDAVKFVETDRPSPVNVSRNWSFGYSKPLINRNFLLKHNIKYKEFLKVGEDFDLYLKCLLHRARFLFVPRPYYYYRNRSSSLSVRKPTEYLYQSHQITRNFLEQEEAVKSNSKLVKAMSQNLIIFQKRLAYYRAVEFIKQKNIIQALKEIVCHPHILVDLIGKLTVIVENKMSCESFPIDSKSLTLFWKNQT